MYAETVAQLQTAQRPAGPERIVRQFKIGDVDVTVYQMVGKERLLLPLQLCLDVAAAKILDKQTFQRNASLLEAARKNHQNKYTYGDGNHQRILKPCKIIADVENETEGNDDTGKTVRKPQTALPAQ